MLAGRFRPLKRHLHARAVHHALLAHQKLFLVHGPLAQSLHPFGQKFRNPPLVAVFAADAGDPVPEYDAQRGVQVCLHFKALPDSLGVERHGFENLRIGPEMDRRTGPAAVFAHLAHRGKRDASRVALLPDGAVAADRHRQLLRQGIYDRCAHAMQPP